MIDMDALFELDFDYYYIILQIAQFEDGNYYAYEVRTLPQLEIIKIGRIREKHYDLCRGVASFPHAFRIKAFYADIGDLRVPTKYVGALVFKKMGG